MLPVAHILWSHVARNCLLGVSTAREFVRKAARSKPGTTPPGAMRLADLMAIPAAVLGLRDIRGRCTALTRIQLTASCSAACELCDRYEQPQGVVVNSRHRHREPCVAHRRNAGYREEGKFSMGRCCVTGGAPSWSTMTASISTPLNCFWCRRIRNDQRRADGSACRIPKPTHRDRVARSNCNRRAGSMDVPDSSRAWSRASIGLSTSSGSISRRVVRYPPVFPPRSSSSPITFASFPDLTGSIHSFHGDDKDHAKLLSVHAEGGDWTEFLEPSGLMLVSAACHPCYPSLTGTLPEGGTKLDVYGYCFRHEPSLGPVADARHFGCMSMCIVGD